MNEKLAVGICLILLLSVGLLSGCTERERKYNTYYGSDTGKITNISTTKEDGFALVELDSPRYGDLILRYSHSDYMKFELENYTGKNVTMLYSFTDEPKLVHKMRKILLEPQKHVNLGKEPPCERCPACDKGCVELEQQFDHWGKILYKACDRCAWERPHKRI